MAAIFPFAALRPTPETVARVAAVPYDVVNSAEFKKALKDNNVILVTWKELQKLLQ